FDRWREAARRLLDRNVSPAEVIWIEAPADEVSNNRETAAAASETSPAGFRVPRRFVDVARRVASHPDPGRWHGLYAVLWRLVRESRDVLDSETDTSVRRLFLLDSEAQRGRACGAGNFVPRTSELVVLQQAAGGCTGCLLYQGASRTVFGRGPSGSRIALVGEQPGDQEDRAGAPFVGPAGAILDRALAEAGLDRRALYVTNVVKHFRFTERGGRRIHQTPRP